MFFRNQNDSDSLARHPKGVPLWRMVVGRSKSCAIKNAGAQNKCILKCRHIQPVDPDTMAEVNFLFFFVNLCVFACLAKGEGGKCPLLANTEGGKVCIDTVCRFRVQQRDSNLTLQFAIQRIVLSR